MNPGQQDYAGDWSSLVLRIFTAWCVFPHGAQKLLGWFEGAGFERIMTGFQERLGIPQYITFLVIVGEFFGSIALVAGLFTRFVAGSFIVIMLGAIFIGGQFQNGFFMNYWGRQQGEGYEYNLLIIGVCITLILLGGRRYSVDRKLNQFLQDHRFLFFTHR